MKITEFVESLLGKLENEFPELRTVQKFTGQFLPESDRKVSYNTPALFGAQVGLAERDRSDASYDVDVLLAFVFVFNTLEPNKRDKEGWDACEKLLNRLSSFCLCHENAGEPRDFRVDKRDKVVEGSSSALSTYSYWTVRCVTPFRLTESFEDL